MAAAAPVAQPEPKPERKPEAKPEPKVDPDQPAFPRRKPPVGSQLYGWGQWYARDKKSLGDHMDEVLSALRDAGYDFAEPSLDLAKPENTAAFADKLKAKGMRPISVYSGGRLHEKDTWEKSAERIITAVKSAAQAGFKVVNLNPDPIGRDKTDEELAVQARALDAVGKAALAVKVLLGVHNHTPEMKNAAKEFHHNLRKTDESTVGFCFDTHWVFRGGLAPMAALREYHERVVSWHLRQSREQTWWEDLDAGDIDYGEIAAFSADHDLAAPVIVELALEAKTKITRTVVENHARSRAFVRKVFGC